MARHDRITEVIIETTTLGVLIKVRRFMPGEYMIEHHYFGKVETDSRRLKRGGQLAKMVLEYWV